MVLKYESDAQIYISFISNLQRSQMICLFLFVVADILLYFDKHCFHRFKICVKKIVTGIILFYLFLWWASFSGI